MQKIQRDVVKTPPGWADIVGIFARDVTQIISLRDLVGARPRVQCEAVVERDGLLSIRMRGGSRGKIVATAKLVGRARTASSSTCAVCAAPGHLRVHRHSPCRCSATRTTSVSIAPTASFGASSSPTLRGTKAPSSVPCWTRPTPAAASGPTPPIAARPTSNCWTAAACAPSSSTPSRAGGRCPRTSPAATPPGPRAQPG